jgi:anti-sigma B factor antagonist
MLTIEGGGDGPVVISGRLDATQAAAAQAYLDRLGGVVTVDCARLEYLSSAGLGVLLKTHKRLLGAGGRLRLTEVNRLLQDIFSYSGFDQILEIEPGR